MPVWVVPGTITFPRQQGAHVIMVGPGTGCAPFRAYIEERVKQNAKGRNVFYAPWKFVTLFIFQVTCCSLGVVLGRLTSSLLMSGSRW